MQNIEKVENNQFYFFSCGGWTKINIHYRNFIAKRYSMTLINQIKWPNDNNKLVLTQHLLFQKKISLICTHQSFLFLLRGRGGGNDNQSAQHKNVQNNWMTFLLTFFYCVSVFSFLFSTSAYKFHFYSNKRFLRNVTISSDDITVQNQLWEGAMRYIRCTLHLTINHYKRNI